MGMWVVLEYIEQHSSKIHKRMHEDFKKNWIINFVCGVYANGEKLIRSINVLQNMLLSQVVLLK